jgi:hypothetical protein
MTNEKCALGSSLISAAHIVPGHQQHKPELDVGAVEFVGFRSVRGNNAYAVWLVQEASRVPLVPSGSTLRNTWGIKTKPGPRGPGLGEK